MIQEKNSDGTWNYWKRDSNKSNCLPDDWDDTAMALRAIVSCPDNELTAADLVQLVNTLIATEDALGGPYNTWILQPWKQTHWYDIDIGVNATIANLLMSIDICPPELVAWIDVRIKNRNFSSGYYSEITIFYLISKWYRGPQTVAIESIILEFLESKPTLFETILLISAWLSLGGSISEIDNHINKIINYCDGPIEPFPFFKEEIIDGIPYYAGSRALTIACLVEVLKLLDHARKQQSEAAYKKQRELLATTLYEKALDRFRDNSEIQTIARKSFDTFWNMDTKCEIALMVFGFHDSLQNLGVSREILDQLAIVNIVGWLGYTIFDNILDHEDQIELIPLATICVREISVALDTLVSDNESKQFVSRILDSVSYSSFCEHSSCRVSITNNMIEIPKQIYDYENYEILAQKSLGHALGPIVIALQSGRDDRFECARSIQEFFTHYLIARQLNDDAHDWIDDLKNGFLNSSSALLFKSFVIKFPNSSYVSIDSGLNQLQELFWNETIETVSSHIVNHVTSARTVLDTMPFLKDISIFENLLIPLERSAQQSISKRNNIKEFLELFQK